MPVTIKASLLLFSLSLPLHSVFDHIITVIVCARECSHRAAIGSFFPLVLLGLAAFYITIEGPHFVKVSASDFVHNANRHRPGGLFDKLSSRGKLCSKSKLCAPIQTCM